MGDATGYTGVVHSAEQVGYSSAEGYTGVVSSPVVSGYTGAAPVTSHRGSGAVSGTGTPRSSPTPSRYDTVVRENAPGAYAATDYLPEPPTLDLDLVREVDETSPDPGPEVSQPVPAPAGPPSPSEGANPGPQADALRTEPGPLSRARGEDQALARALSSLVDDWLDLERRGRLSPGPIRNEALEPGLRSLSGPGALAPFGGPYPARLLGELAPLLDEQIEQALDSAPATDLGVAYLQGLGQGLLSALAGTGAGLAGSALDPVGSAVSTASSLLAELRRRTDNGESLYEAANGVFNPVVQATEAWIEADELAGEALQAARAGDWREAAALSRAAGRRAFSFSTGVTDTLTAAAGAAKVPGRASRFLRARNKSLTSSAGSPALSPLPPPHAPHPSAVPRADGPTPRLASDGVGPLRPTSVKRVPDGVTGSVQPGKPPMPAVRPPAPRHPRWPNVPVLGRGKSARLRDMARATVEARLRDARRTLSALPKDLRSHHRAAAMKPVYNAQERLDALQQQLRHPDRAYLYDVEVLGVETPGGLVTPDRIPGMRAADGRHPGRTFDVYELRPDGSHRPRELKTSRTQLDAFPKRGVQVQYKRGSKLGKQLRKTQALQDFAVQKGGRILVRGTALDGSSIRLSLDPGPMRSTVVADYDATDLN
ncbi:hypothetical protein [Streptomyces sp. NPDC058572]|uniref:hypothetical protein n=1 Tax=Streptomyces sp. NPDC058572 TaxID=3346546 RepID=UPI003658F74B